MARKSLTKRGGSTKHPKRLSHSEKKGSLVTSHQQMEGVSHTGKSFEQSAVEETGEEKLGPVFRAREKRSGAVLPRDLYFTGRQSREKSC